MKKETFRLIDEEKPELCERCFIKKYGRNPDYWELAYSGEYAASLHRCKMCGE